MVKNGNNDLGNNTATQKAYCDIFESTFLVNITRIY